MVTDNSTGDREFQGSLPRYAVTERLRVHALRFEQALACIDTWIAQGEHHYVNLCTAHTALECYRSPELAAIIRGAGMATPDGMPLVWLGRLRGYAVDRVYGPDLMWAVCERGIARGYRHFFYGGEPGVADKLATRLRQCMPGIRIVGTHSPPFRELTDIEEQAVAAMINHSHADLVWVGLGAPKQDYWVAHFRPKLTAPVLIAVGAAFNFLSGRVRQAPRWMQRTGLEWLFRLSQEPRRLWRRYLIGNPMFFLLAMRQLAREQIRSLES
mgnify:CR=1 FL=1